MRTHLISCLRLLCVSLIFCVSGCQQQEDQLIDIEGISSLTVKHEPPTAFWELAWSPDGRSVAALAYAGKNNSSVALIDVETGTSRTIYESGGAYMLGPEWSPNGKTLVFVAPTEWTPHQGGVVVADAESGQIIHNLHVGAYATWSVDKERIIVLGIDSPNQEEVPIYEYDLNTGKSHLLGSTIAGLAESGNRLDVSPDGKLLVSDSTGTRTEILDIADGTVLGALSPPVKSNTAWSPTGGTLAYIVGGVDSQAANDGIILASADGNCSSNPLQLGVEFLSLDWSPDGNQLVFSTRDVNRLYFLDFTAGVGKELMDSYRERCSE